MSFINIFESINSRKIIYSEKLERCSQELNFDNYIKYDDILLGLENKSIKVYHLVSIKTKKLILSKEKIKDLILIEKINNQIKSLINLLKKADI